MSIFCWSFIYILIIIVFCITTSSKPSEENEKYRDYAEIHKARLLERLEELRKDGIRVQVNVEQDILTLPEVFFWIQVIKT